MAVGHIATTLLLLAYCSVSVALAQSPLSKNEQLLWGECSKTATLTSAIESLAPATIFVYNTPSLPVPEFALRIGELGYKDDLGVRRAALTSWKFSWKYSDKVVKQISL